MNFIFTQIKFLLLSLSVFHLFFFVLLCLLWNSINENTEKEKKKKKKRVDCKLHPWSLGLIGYTPKFQKLDFTPWSLIPLAIYPPQLVFGVKWHIIMLMCFIIANSALKLHRFNDDQARSWHNQNYVVLGLNLKQKFLAWNDVVSCQTLKSKTRTMDPTVCLLEHRPP